MRKIITALTIAYGATTLSGCVNAEDKNLEGLTLTGGDAIAHNSTLQIIDPWPAGVQDTKLIVPADRGKQAAQSGQTAASGATTSLTQ
jgi:hypothetical protein